MSEIERLGPIPPGVTIGINLQGTAQPGLYRAIVLVKCDHKNAQEELKAKNVAPEFLSGTLEEIWQDITSGNKLKRIREKVLIAEQAEINDAKTKREAAEGKESPETPARRGPGRPRKSETTDQGQLDLEKEAGKAAAPVVPPAPKKPLQVVAAEHALDQVDKVIISGKKAEAKEKLAEAQTTCGAAKEFAVKPEFSYLVTRFRELKKAVDEMPEEAPEEDPFA